MDEQAPNVAAVGQTGVALPALGEPTAAVVPVKLRRAATKRAGNPNAGVPAAGAAVPSGVAVEKIAPAAAQRPQSIATKTFTPDMNEPEETNPEKKLKDAYEEFTEAKNGIFAAKERFIKSSKEFYRAILACRADGDYRNFTRRMAAVLDISDSQSDMYLKAARFTEESGLLKPHRASTKMPHASALAAAHSKLHAKGAVDRKFGRWLLVQARKGENFPSTRFIQRNAERDNGISYILANNGVVGDVMVIALARFLSAIAAGCDSGDQSIASLQKLVALVRNGHPVRLRMIGETKINGPYPADLADEVDAVLRDAQAELLRGRDARGQLMLPLGEPDDRQDWEDYLAATDLPDGDDGHIRSPLADDEIPF